MSEERTWRTRGYIPHIDAPGLTQFLTWRTADALPSEVVETWREELSHLPEAERKSEEAKRAERYADAGHGECLLRQPEIARIVQEGSSTITDGNMISERG